jgi:hypothetical protein
MKTWATIVQEPECNLCLGSPLLYRLSDYGVQFSATLSGNGTCSGCFANSECCPVTHSAYNRVGWAGAAVSSTTGTSAATIGASGGSFSTTTTTTLLDIFDCFEDNPNCTPEGTQEVSCSALGQIYSGNPLLPMLPEWEFAITLGKWTGEYGGCTEDNFGLTHCTFRLSITARLRRHLQILM